MLVEGKPYRTVWAEGPAVKLIDQTALPHTFRIANSPSATTTAQAIKTMVVRGAGAIGATAAYGVAQAVREAAAGKPSWTRETAPFPELLQQGAGLIRNTRPTAQNLFFAIDRVLASIQGQEPVLAASAAAREAQKVADEDAAACQRIGEIGSALLKPNSRMLTHCNAGWLAFVDWGSALSPVYAAKRQGKQVFVYADETRPRSQGAKLTAWELSHEGIPHALIPDTAAGHFLRKDVDLVIVGADRIAANGDVANKIGTSMVALAAEDAGVPFYVAAPTSTIDPACPTGAAIPIEERSSEEVLLVEGLSHRRPTRVSIAPEGTPAQNPAFDITPAKRIAGIITERGIFKAKQVTKALKDK